MKKVKYVGGLGDVAEIIFKGSRSYNFKKGQELIIDDVAADQLLETPHFKEVELPKDEAKEANKQAEEEAEALATTTFKEPEIEVVEEVEEVKGDK